MANFLHGTTVMPYATLCFSHSTSSRQLGLCTQRHLHYDRRNTVESSDQGKYRESPSEILLLPLHVIQLRGIRALVRDAQPHDSLVFYCA
jgi:hypothetical protein